jgi:hypothetical protein
LVSQITFSSATSDSNTVLVPIGASGAVRLRAAAAHVSATVTLIGYLAAPGTATAGDFAGHQLTMLATPINSAPLSVTAASTTIPGQNVAGIPVAGAHGLVLQVTVTGASAAGALRLYANGTGPPTAPSLRFSPGTPVTTTVIVSSAVGGLIRLATDGPTISCRVEVIGYATPS